jgi:EmrB/QacA subfamily drug resistance transporter
MDDSIDSKESWLVLITVSLSAFIITLDSTFMNVSLSYIIGDLNTTLSTVQLIILTYTLTVASLMLFGGKLQDIIGRRKTFITGAVIYGIGAFIATLSLNSMMLFVGWSILEGVGSAFMIPAVISIITGSYLGEKRTFALGVRTAIAGGAAALGPLIGGFLTSFLSWRYGFALELAIVLLVLVLSRKIKHFPPTLDKSELDKLGILLSGTGFFALVLGIWSINFLKNHFLSIGLIIMGILILILFVIGENRRIKINKEPLTDIRFFTNRNFTTGTVNRVLIQMTMAGTIFILPVFLQQIIQADAFTTGLALLPLTLGYLIFSITSSKLASNFEPRYIISSGFLMAMVASIFLSYQFNLYTSIWQLVPGTFFLGAGMGLSLPLSTDVTLSAVPLKKHSDASGLVSTFSNLGSSMGTAVVGIVLIMGLINGMTTAVTDTFPEQYTPEQIQPQVNGWLEKMSASNVTELKAHEQSHLSVLVNVTVNEEMKTTFQFVGLIFLAGFISSLFMKPLNSSKHQKFS